MESFDTLEFAVDGGVATITLDRPERLNAYNQTMLDEFAAVWTLCRDTDAIRAIVLQANGDRAFSTGVDVTSPQFRHPNPWSELDPGVFLGPKQNRVWKPVVAAVHGMACGGAFYWINESDIVIGSDDAEFFDPHVTFGLTAALEPIGLARRVPLGEALRIALMGLDERVSAARALQIGLVTEVVPRDALRDRAQEIARSLAGKPAAAIQGTVRAIWESIDLPLSVARERGLAYCQLGNPLAAGEVDRATVERPKPVIR
jgi:enoyl-CoA hydratase/carnithine racemase